MKKKILNILKYVLFTSLGVGMFWLVYRDQDFTHIFNVLKNEVNYSWVALSLFLGLLSHISRTLRWKIALEPLGEKPKTSNTFITIMASYFMNLLLPRMGEFVRCGLLSKYEKIPFTKLFGTVVTERIVDVIMLFVLLLLMAILEMDKLIAFSDHNPGVVEKIQSMLSSPILWIAIIFILGSVIFYVKISKKKGKENKITELLHEFGAGIKSILAMKRYKAYIIHTVFIWTMYFLMLYFYFFSLEFTRHLNIEAALTTFTMTSFSMVAPVQGGIGAWHFMAEQSLLLYGIESANGKLFALLAHSSTNIFVLILGAVCLIILPMVNRKPTPKTAGSIEITES